LAEPLDRYDAELTTPDTVILELVAQDKIDAAAQLAHRLYAAGRISNLEGFLEQVHSREHQLATGLPGGIGLPHARSEFVDEDLDRSGNHQVWPMPWTSGPLTVRLP
jgi:PTS system fructose-specific IIA component